MWAKGELIIEPQRTQRDTEEARSDVGWTERNESLRSRDPRTRRSEKLYVIKGLTFDGVDVYTKGKILNTEMGDVFHVLISSKRSTDL